MTPTITQQTPKSNDVDQLDRPAWLPHAQWPFVLRRYDHPHPDTGASAIHYTDEGTGPTLVFVHAGLWSFMWRDAIRTLRRDFRCITLDFPGAGLSAGTRHDVDLATYAAILTGLLDRCGVERATFVLHDLGGVVGVTAAAERPARVAGLVATNSFAWSPDTRGLRIMLRVMGSRTASGVLGTLRTVPRMTRSKMGVGRHYERADRSAFFGPYRRRSAARNFHRTMRSARKSTNLFTHTEASLQTTLHHVPLLTVFGEKNDPFGFADRWESIYPAADTWVVEGGNHFPMCDDPDGFAKRLNDWHRTEVSATPQ